MASILENEARVGNFTSSQLHRLLTGTRGLTDKQLKDLIKHKDRHALAEIGEAKVLTPNMLDEMQEFQEKHDNPPPTTSQATYIEEKQIERRLGRPISTDKYGRPMAWGHFMEQFVFTKFTGLEYQITANKTTVHPTIKQWSGSTDLIVPGVKVSDIKCFEPKKFALYTDALLLKDVDNLRENFAVEYWQLVSNAIINNVPNAEAITFIPYKEELEEIREMAANYDGEDQWKYKFICDANDIELPYIPEGGYYKNLNRFEFEVPIADREFCEKIVLESIELLNA